METIYTGNEPMLNETLIEKAIEENHVNVFEITKISVNCYTPDDKMPLWHIVITINNTRSSWRSDFFAKKCISHGYSITYLQHLENMGVKKLNFKKMKYKGGKND